MRNYFAIAFTCVYLILTVGVAKTTHYCMGRLNHSAIYTFESKKCPCARLLKGPSPCCKDEHELIIIDGDQSHAEVLAAQAPGFFEIGDIYIQTLYTTLTSVQQDWTEFVLNNSPPPRPPIYKLNCSFVF